MADVPNPSPAAREVSFIIDVDRGTVRVVLGSSVTQNGPNPSAEGAATDIERGIGDEIGEIKRGRRHMRVSEILHTTESPGCVYWNGLRWVKYC